MNSNNQHPDLAKWHQILHDYEYLFDSPSTHRADLVARAGKLQAAGIIDPLEHFDLCDLALGAYTHAAESKLDDFLQPSYQYNLVTEDGAHAGYMDGYSIYFKDSMAMHDRGVCRRGEHHFRVIPFDTRLKGGQIIKDRMTVDGHPPYRLVPRSRRIKGVIVPLEKN